LSLIFIALGFALGKLTFEIGDPLLGIGERAVGRRAHLRTSSRPTFRADHTMIDTGHRRLPRRAAERGRPAGPGTPLVAISGFGRGLSGAISGRWFGALLVPPAAAPIYRWR